MEVHMLVVVLFTVMVSSEEVKENLTGTVGGSITLPDPVEEQGSLYFGGKVITLVIDRKIVSYNEAFKDKFLWNNNTGLFTITRLQKSYSGIYTIESKKGKVYSHFYKLTVYDPVSTPAVKAVNVSSESCTLLCSVEKTEETTLLWYKDEQMLDQSSSSLSLLLTVLKKDFSSSYRCVAANPADQQTLQVNVTTSCIERKDEPRGGNDGDRDRYVVVVVTPIVLLIVILVVLYKWKCSDKNKKTTTHQQSSKSQRAEETTVVLYKVQQMLNRSSSSLSYRCAAANPADRKTFPVNMTITCSYEN